MTVIFLALFQDVTYLKQGHKDPQKWTSKEVALFLAYFERLESPDSSMNIMDIIIEHRINGARFMTATEEDWIRYGVTSEMIRRNLLDAMRLLETNCHNFVRKFVDDYDYTYFEPQPDSVVEFEAPDGTVNVGSPRQLQFWNQQQGTLLIPFFFLV